MFFSSRKLAANQANAQESSGPVSDAGIAKSATNSRKHGLTGRFTVLAGENQEAFDSLFEQFVRDEKPVGSVELELVRKMAEHTCCASALGVVSKPASSSCRKLRSRRTTTKPKCACALNSNATCVTNRTMIAPISARPPNC